VSPVTRTPWVTFDGVGSLIDWQGLLTSVVGRLAGDRRGEFLRVYAESESVVTRRQPHTSYRDVIVTALRHAAERTGVPFSRRAEQDVLASWHALQPCDDADALMAGLRARGYRLAALADCDDDQFEIAHRTFRQPFDLFLTAERVRAYKPSPLPFRAFQMITGARSSDWVHVGSSRDRDIAPAAALGVSAVWLDRSRCTGTAPRASAHVYSGLEALSAIAQFLEPAATCAT
jgi:2-haloalkanoic acid dehalogenase type II